MRNMARKDWLIVVLVIVTASEGVALWRLKFRAVEKNVAPATPIAAVGAAAPVSEVESGEKRAELAQLRKENAQLSNRLAEIASMHEPRLPALPTDATELEKSLKKQVETRRLAQNPKPSVFDLGLSVSQEFCEAYGLDAAERQRLDESFRKASDTLKRVSAGHTRGRYVDGDTYELSISPFPEEGGAIYDRLMAEVEDVLGTRYDEFLQLSADEVERRFGGLGTKTATLKVGWNSGRKQYDIENVDTTAGGTSKNTFSAAYIEALDGLYPHLAHLLPAELRARSTEADLLKRAGW